MSLQANSPGLGYPKATLLHYSVYSITSIRRFFKCIVKGRAEPLKGATPPKGGLATLPTTPPPLVGGSAREVSDLAVSLNVVGVGVGAQW